MVRKGVLAAWLLGAFFLVFPPQLRAEPPEFSRVARLFAEHCLDCHSASDPDGKLVLETYDTAMKGGESGPAILSGKSSESLLVRMIEGRVEKDGKSKIMPPGKRKKLAAAEIAEIRAWIDAGAKAPAAGSVAVREIVVPKIVPTAAVRRAVTALAYEPKAKLLAIARPGEVELHSAESQMAVRTLAGPAGNINAVVFSPDGEFVFAAGGDPGMRGEIRQWKVADGAPVRTMAGHADSIYALAVSPDGRLLASGSYDQKIKLWQTGDGAEARTLAGHNGCVYGLAFRPDGKILASASGDRTVKLWDVATGERRDTLSQALKDLYAVAFSPDGHRLAAAGVDRRIRVWEISGDARETTNPLLHSRFAHDGAVLRLAFSPDGQWLASSADDKTLKLWDARELRELRSFETQPDWVSGLVFALGNKGLAAGRLDGAVAIYDAQQGGIVPPPSPELTGAEPRALTRGVPAKIKISGQHLQRLREVQFDDPRLQAKILTSPAPSPSEAWLEVTSDPALARGPRKLSLKGGKGAATVYLEDLPVRFEGTSPELAWPVSLWGEHRESGERDIYTFQAAANDTLVFDGSAKSIGSKADLVLTLLDEDGKVLAGNHDFDRSGDPLLVHRFARPGRYRLAVQELVPAGSPEHFYRIAIGAFPFVTAAYPPVVRRSVESEVELIGYNLGGEAFESVTAGGEGSEVALDLDPEKYRWRREVKLAVTDLPPEAEWEPNDRPADATAIAAPGVAAGRITMRGQADWFRFPAKGGQTWVVETRAQALGGPLDTRIEICDARGEPIVRTLLQAVRDSAITFRGIDSLTVDCRVENWEEMELNQYLYLEGEVVRLFRAPQGPDSGFNFYGVNGSRRTYFDTTATAHANAEPCYIVEAHPPGTPLGANGLPVFPIRFENDDDAERQLGSDSRVYFTAPADGDYLVRVTDTRGFGGARYLYSLAVRPARPDFKLRVEGANPTIAKGSGQRFAIHADRIDGFDGEIKIELSGVPAGFTASNPVVIQAGHDTAFGTLCAAENAGPPAETIQLRASAELDGQPVQREAGTLGKITLSGVAPLFVGLEPSGAGLPEITIAPGGSVPAHLKIRRNGHTELVTFQVENLPHGVIVDNIGLNGVLIPKDQDQREIFLTAAKWVPETDRLCYAVANEAGRQTSLPILLKVRKSGGQVAKK